MTPHTRYCQVWMWCSRWKWLYSINKEKGCPKNKHTKSNSKKEVKLKLNGTEREAREQQVLLLVETWIYFSLQPRTRSLPNMRLPLPIQSTVFLLNKPNKRCKHRFSQCIGNVTDNDTSSNYNTLITRLNPYRQTLLYICIYFLTYICTTHHIHTCMCLRIGKVWVTTLDPSLCVCVNKKQHKTNGPPRWIIAEWLD